MSYWDWISYLVSLSVSPSKTLTANETMFGWVISGYCESPNQAVTAHICCRVEISSKTDELLRAFIESEEPPSDAQDLSPDEQLSVTHFQDTIVETLMDATLLRSH